MSKHLGKIPEAPPASSVRMCKNHCQRDEILKCAECLARSFMSHPLAEFWDIGKNERTPLQVALNDHRKYHFICDVCHHNFEADPSSINGRGSWCPYCANKRLCPPDVIFDCDKCFPRCFMSHPRSQYWDVGKNETTPLEVSLKSEQKCHYTCEVCLHGFASIPASVTSGTWCPYCVNQKRCPPDLILDCDHCISRSFMSHHRAECWDVEKNERTPFEVALNDHRKYHFVCDVCHHSFEADPSSINGRGRWCPYCANLKRCAPETIFTCNTCFPRSFVSHPRAKCWDAVMNTLTPLEVALCDNRAYQMICDMCHHNFPASPAHVSSGGWCPYCANLKRCPPDAVFDCEKCLSRCFMSHPCAEWWDIGRNTQTPLEVALNDCKKYWYLCDVCQHGFKSSPAEINRGNGCPYCAKQKRCPPESILDCNHCLPRCFMSHPRAPCWDNERNTVTPTEVALNDCKKYWFVCDVCQHNFKSTPAEINRGNWCPYCANRKRCPPDEIMHCKPCFGQCFMSHPRAQFWDADKNDVTPLEVARGSNEKYDFICGECNHTFAASPTQVGRGNWCPFCANLRRCPPDSIMSCSYCLPKCFMSHPRAEFWDVQRNAVTPLEVALSDDRRFFQLCGVCQHSFEASPTCLLRGPCCPYCSNLKRCPPDVIVDCDYCFPRCLMSHPRAEFWDTHMNAVTPLEVALNDNNCYYFTCDVCWHGFDSSPGKVNSGRWCPYCANKKRCAPDVIVDCDRCFSKCFMSHPQAEFWDFGENTVTPMEIALNDSIKYYFVCDMCEHTFRASPANINSGTWCPACKRKTQRLVYDWCREIFTRNDDVEWEPRFSWCVSIESGRLLPFDIVIHSERKIVEVDGKQHFELVAKWRSNPAGVMKRDAYKMRCALKEGYKIIRLSQEDVWRNKAQWKIKFKEALHTRSDIEYLSSRQETYAAHKCMMES